MADTRGVHPAILPAALAFFAALAISIYVGLRREKSDLHWFLLALLGSLMLWTAGNVARFSVDTIEGLQASLRLVFLGVFTTPPLWLLLAARYARVRWVIERRDLWVAMMIPSALVYLALLTNDGHRLVIREVSFEALSRGGPAWAGPVFWAFMAWGYFCVIGGVALYVNTARRILVNEERRRAALLAVASLIPLLISPLYMFRWLPVSFDLTPAALAVSIGIISVTVFRYQLLESLPLARRDVIEHLRDGVMMANGAGVILDLNPAAERILHRDAEELRRLTLVQVLSTFARGVDDSPLRDPGGRLAPGSPPLVTELRTRDGRRIEVFAAWVRDAGGEPAGQFAMLHDRTEERRSERAVRQNQKLESMGTLASGIAHEVNNPLAFIRANLTQMKRMGDLVESHAVGSEAKLAGELSDLGQIADEALDGIGRIERIVADMRRLSSGSDDPVVPVDVGAAVEDAIRLANLRDDPRVRVSLRVEDSLPPVEGSPERLVQALLNLLVNARQALAGVADAQIVVETGREQEAVVVRVSDNGPGVPEAIQERIFDPFFTTKDPDKGTGLGLAIAFDILRDHGGVIELSSPPGAGAVFSIRLPLCHD